VILQREADDPGYVAGADPLGDVATVLFHRPFGEVNLVADLPGCLLLTDEPDDLDLAGGKAGIGDDQPGVFFFGKDPVDDMVTGFLAKILLPFEQRLNGLCEFSVVLVLYQVAVYAGAEHFQDRGGIAVEGIGEDAGGGAAILDLFDNGIPTKIGEHVVDDDELRLVLDGQRRAGSTCVGVPEIPELITDQQSYSVDDHIVVVDD